MFARSRSAAPAPLAPTSSDEENNEEKEFEEKEGESKDDDNARHLRVLLVAMESKGWKGAELADALGVDRATPARVAVGGPEAGSGDGGGDRAAVADPRRALDEGPRKADLPARGNSEAETVGDVASASSLSGLGHGRKAVHA